MRKTAMCVVRRRQWLMKACDGGRGGSRGKATGRLKRATARSQPNGAIERNGAASYRRKVIKNCEAIAVLSAIDARGSGVSIENDRPHGARRASGA